MKALLYTEPFHFEYVDYPEPSPAPDHLLIRVEACGICGSDVHGYTGSTGQRIPPLIMGHEAAGVVHQVGEDVKGFQKGDRVAFDSTVYCNQCEACRRGQYNYCIRRQVLGVSIPGNKRDGAFAELVAVPGWIASKLPDSLAFADAALLEPVSVAVHAASRAVTDPTTTVVIFGAGTIGLLLLQAVNLKPVGRLIVCDINEARLEMAEDLGATETINPDKIDLQGYLLDRTGGRGADLVFDAVGLAATFQQSVSITRMGGQITLIGNLAKTVEMNLQDVVSKELTLRGSYASAGEYRGCIQLVASQKIRVAPLISGVLPLQAGQNAFDRLHKGEEDLLKIVLEP